MSPPITIGMPAYNDAAFISRAIDTLLAQSFSDFTLHISDDASFDGTEEICREYVRADSRIVYERQESNLGIARNMALLRDKATSELFAWAADDDVWHPDFLDTLNAGLLARPDAVVAFCPVRYIDVDDVPLTERSDDYGAPTAAARLAKLTRAWDDSFGYGLFRRSATLGMRFPTWWGPNRRTSQHLIFPSLYYALALGDFVLCGDEPLWCSRVKPAERMNYDRHLHDDHFVRGSAVIALRKVNVGYECVAQVAEAAGWWLALRASPALAARLLRDIARAVAAKAVRMVQGRASIW